MHAAPVGRAPGGAVLAQITLFLAILGAGIAIGLAAYGRLLRRLREHHSTEFRHLGSPQLFDASPRRGLALQRFVYGHGIRHEDAALRRLSRFVAVFNPLLVIAVFVQLLRVVAALDV